MKSKLNKVDVSSSRYKEICTNTKKEFSKCECNQCKKFINLLSNGIILPSDIKKYIYFERT